MVENVSVSGGITKNVNLVAAENVTLIVWNGDEPRSVINAEEAYAAPVRAGDKAGTLEYIFEISGESVGTDLVFDEDVDTAGLAAQTAVTMPTEMEAAIQQLTFWQSIPAWAVSLIGSLVIIALSFVMIMSVYGRFFKLYLYTAIAPIPLSSFAGEPSANIGKSFLKSYAAVCLEGAIIVLGCIIFSEFASSPPVVEAGASPVTMVWSYMGELIFNLLVLTGAVKMADRVVREMFGL